MMIYDDSPLKRLPPRPVPPDDPPFKDTFDLTVSSGDEWVSLANDHGCWISPEGFGNQQVTWRKEMASSRFYHGSYMLHATKENVTENLTVYVRGDSQNDVTESVMLIEDLFSQPSFRVRVQFGNHRETWYCQTADYQIDRGHVMMHNHMAKVALSIPRLPETTKEIIL